MHGIRFGAVCTLFTVLVAGSYDSSAEEAVRPVHIAFQDDSSRHRLVRAALCTRRMTIASSYTPGKSTPNSLQGSGCQIGKVVRIYTFTKVDFMRHRDCTGCARMPTDPTAVDGALDSLSNAEFGSSCLAFLDGVSAELASDPNYR